MQLGDFQGCFNEGFKVTYNKRWILEKGEKNIMLTMEAVIIVLTIFNNDKFEAILLMTWEAAKVMLFQKRVHKIACRISSHLGKKLPRRKPEWYILKCLND